MLQVLSALLLLVLSHSTWSQICEPGASLGLCMGRPTSPVCPANPKSMCLMNLPAPVCCPWSKIVYPAPDCTPTNDPPRQADIWDLWYYYNYGRILHGFAATPEGYDRMQNNGIGYDGGDWATSGSLGGTLSDDGFARLAEVCSDKAERDSIRKMWFSLQGVAYQHVFEDSPLSKDVYVGYVATKANACGSKWPVKRWSCAVSADAMYAGNINSNPWYAGRAGPVVFWLWETIESERDKQRTAPGPACVASGPTKDDLWNLNYYYNWARNVHAFAATNTGYSSIMNNGIGYSSHPNGAGVLGGTLSDQGFANIATFCKDATERNEIVQMWFSKQGDAYQHVFAASTLSKDVYVGYVSLKANACGAKWPMKQWTSTKSADIMYAGEMKDNSWYEGGVQDGGKVQFWLWETNESILK